MLIKSSFKNQLQESTTRINYKNQLWEWRRISYNNQWRVWI